MNEHSFRNLLPAPDAPDDAQRAWLERRPALRPDHTAESAWYVPDEGILTALELALTLGAPLLVTGEPGSGKTQLAYYAARRLGLGRTLHFQVRSTSTAKELKYTFDTIAYFRAAHVSREQGPDAPMPDKRTWLAPGPLWEALETDRPRLLLVDEIDKAPRDFPNDLLHELDQMELTVPELERIVDGKAVPFTIRLEDPRLRPLVVLTSNSEHRLPEAFLRRCVYHHIQITRERLREIVMKRRASLGNPSDRLIEVAIRRYYELKEKARRKPPSTAELLAWIRLLAGWAGTQERILEELPLEQLPFKGVLLKTREDLEAAGG